MEVGTLRAQTPAGSRYQEAESWVGLCNQLAPGPWDRASFSLCLAGPVPRLKCFPAHSKQTLLTLSDLQASMCWPAAPLTLPLPLIKPCSQTRARK